MYLDYPLLSLILTGCWMAVLAGVFLAFGWCDPREYQRKLGLDIFSGVMAIVALRVGSHMKDVVYATVTPSTDGKLFNLDAIVQFAQGYYDQMNFEQVFSTVDNQLMALIIIGIAIMFIAVISIISLVFGIYFVFRMCVLLDVYINNIVRFIIMGAALVITLIVGLVAHQVPLMLITMLIGIISIIKLAIGHVLLYYYGEGKQPEPVHAKAGAPAKRPASNGRPSAPANPPSAARRPQASGNRTQPSGNRPQPPVNRPASTPGTRPTSTQQPGNRVPPASRPAPTNSRPQPPVKSMTEEFPFTSSLRDMSNPKTPPAPRTRPAPKPPTEWKDDEK